MKGDIDYEKAELMEEYKNELLQNMVDECCSMEVRHDDWEELVTNEGGRKLVEVENILGAQLA